MSLPEHLWNYLAVSEVSYEIIEHRHSVCSAGSARTAGVPMHQLAKSVVVEDDDGCLVALVPADRSVQLGRLAQLLRRSHLHLADEAALGSIFGGCELGAIPGLAMAWGVETVVDDQLEACDAVYLECGDHERLLRLTRSGFHTLMQPARHGAISGARVH